LSSVFMQEYSDVDNRKITKKLKGGEKEKKHYQDLQ